MVRQFNDFNVKTVSFELCCGSWKLQLFVLSASWDREAHFYTDQYFENHLSLTKQEANDLHLKYYREYGLAIEGLVRHHKVDALEYNAKVDDALPLEDIIKPNAELRSLLEDIDKSKVKMWLFTNAYVTHGKRVVKLLGIDDLFEGMTFCDYGSEKFYCKPHVEMYEKAMSQAGIQSNEDCYFVGMRITLRH